MVDRRPLPAPVSQPRNKPAVISTSTSTTETQTKPLPATWESNVAIPLAQNLAGGLAAGTLVIVLDYAWSLFNGLQRTGHIYEWAILVGASVAGTFTVIRFFGDELGLLNAAYIAGQHSRDEEIQRLNRQISLMEASGSTTASQATTVNQTLGRMQGDYENAKQLLKILLEGGSVARDSGEHGLTKRPWERAITLLGKAHIYDHTSGQLLITSRGETLRLLTSFYNEQYQLAQQNAAFHPAWW